MEGKNSAAINRKRQRIMTKWLDMPQKFRSPMATKSKMDAGVEQGDV